MLQGDVMQPDLERDFNSLDSADTANIVKSAVIEAFGNDVSQNNGKIENHCDEHIKEYYLKLANNDKGAKAKQKQMLEKFMNDKRF